MVRSTVASVVVFGVVFGLLAVIGIIARALGDLFVPIALIALAAAVLFFVLNMISGWAAADEPPA